MKICKNCNLVFQDEFSFCSKCGGKLDIYQQGPKNIDTEVNQNTDNKHSNEESHNKNNLFYIIAALVLVAIGVIFFIGNSDTNTSSDSSVNKKVVEEKLTPEAELSKNYKPINIVDGTLYVPKAGFLQVSSSKPSPDGKAIKVFTGHVTKKSNFPNKNDLYDNLYDINVIYGESEELRFSNPDQEKEIFNKVFNALWYVAINSKDYKLISKSMHTNIHGNKYLKYSYTVNSSDNEKGVFLNNSAIYIFGDCMYIIDIGTHKTVAEKYKAEIDLILDSFTAKNYSSEITSSKSANLIRKGIITGTDVLMRSGPGKQYQDVGIFKKHETVTILEEQPNWFKVKPENRGNPVWVYSRYCAENVESNTAEKSYHIFIKKSAFTLYILDDKNNVRVAYDCSIGRNPGQKQKSGDMRTPNGTFYIDEIYSSSNWTHDFGDGKGEVEGVYGPWFFNINTYTLSKGSWGGIGIRGTHTPEIMRSRATEGSICLQNQNIEDLTKYIRVGTKVTIEE